MWGLKSPDWYTANDFRPLPAGGMSHMQKFVRLEEYEALERAAQAFVDSQAQRD